jgi:hypothetical protein
MKSLHLKCLPSLVSITDANSNNQTICATRSEDGNGGLFGNRYTDRKDVRGIEQAGPQFLGRLNDSQSSESQIGVFGRLEFEHHSGGKGGNEYSSTPGFERPWVEPLMLRAWAFQERLLSYRTVDFLSAEMVWECRESQRCECTQADRRDQEARMTEKKIFLDLSCLQLTIMRLLKWRTQKRFCPLIHGRKSSRRTRSCVSHLDLINSPRYQGWPREL